MRGCIAILVAISSLLAEARDVAAQARLWRPDDRVTITSFDDVRAIAYDGRRVFAATSNGLEIYDEIARRWLAPSTREDGYPAYERPLAIAYDRSQGGLWLRTDGGVYLFSDLGGTWDRRSAFEMPQALQNDRAPEADIAWRALRGTVTMDSQARRWPLTAVTAGERSGTYWVGTGGGNILFADTRSLRSEWLSFGTLSRGTSAIGVAADGSLWFGSDGLGPRNGLTRTDEALSSWLYFEPITARAPRREVRRILPGETTWVAAADGVYALGAGARSWQRIGESNGLPSDNVGTIARSEGRVWAATSRGIASIDEASMRVTWQALAGVRVTDLVVQNDTLWIASSEGLFAASLADSTYTLALAPGGESVPALRRAITGLALTPKGIAVLAFDAVYLRRDAWETLATRNAAPLAVAGRPHALRADDGGLFVLGSRGFSYWSAGSGTWSYLTVPADIPEGPVYDVVRMRDYVWVATPGGAIRLQWR